jgi:uncharacterized BrkB/YihY/UPF0761 family membrane protein
MVAGWLVASVGFNWYLVHVASYNKTYGVLGTFVILMVWIYIAALIALSGGAIDVELQEFRKTTVRQTVSSQVSSSALRASQLEVRPANMERIP